MVKRYTLELKEDGDGLFDVWMDESAAGGFVTYDDYEMLERRLKNTLAALMECHGYEQGGDE